MSDNVWLFSRAMQRAALSQGWYIFDNQSAPAGLQVERIDTQDDPFGAQLEDDDEAIVLAQRMGVPCDDNGQFPDDFLLDEE